MHLNGRHFVKKAVKKGLGFQNAVYQAHRCTLNRGLEVWAPFYYTSLDCGKSEMDGKDRNISIIFVHMV